MSKTTRKSEDNFDEAWSEIEKDLADIDAPRPEEYTTPRFSDTPHNMGNPRDWKPADDDEYEDIMAEYDDTSYRNPAPLNLSQYGKLTVGAWLASLTLLVLSVIIALDILPVSHTWAIVSGCAGVASAIFAVFLSARSAGHSDM